VPYLISKAYHLPSFRGSIFKGDDCAIGIKVKLGVLERKITDNNRPFLSTPTVALEPALSIILSEVVVVAGRLLFSLTLPKKFHKYFA
jgi:hypothetical protein